MGGRLPHSQPALTIGRTSQMPRHQAEPQGKTRGSRERTYSRLLEEQRKWAQVWAGSSRGHPGAISVHSHGQQTDDALNPISRGCLDPRDPHSSSTGEQVDEEGGLAGTHLSHGDPSAPIVNHRTAESGRTRTSQSQEEHEHTHMQNLNIGRTYTCAQFTTSLA